MVKQNKTPTEGTVGVTEKNGVASTGQYNGNYSTNKAIFDNLPEEEQAQLLAEKARKRGVVNVNYPPVAVDENLADLPLMDIKGALAEGEFGDGRLFGQLYANRLVYDHGGKQWYWWKGHSWEVDATRQTKRLVSGQLASQYLLAVAKENLVGDETAVASLQKDVRGRVAKLKTAKGRDSALDYAQSFLPMDGKWDANLGGRLPVANGVVDMATGVLSHGRPADYIRTVAPHDWHGIDTPAPRFERFIQEIFGGDVAVAQFVQRWLGYAASGRATEHKLPVFWGAGRNGKDTLLEALAHALGALAGAASKDVLLDTGRDRAAGSASPHLMALQGKRLAWVSEPKDGARLDVAQVKLITGGGTISARPMYGSQLEFAPTHALALLTNHKPQAPADDFALWQRLLLVPFTQTFVANPTDGQCKADPNLGEDLRYEASGILAWLVRGYQDYLSQGLNPPPQVQEATAEYQQTEDRIGLFTAECCLVATHAEAKAGELYMAYKAWCEGMGLRPYSGVRFGEKMASKFEKGRSSSGIVYRGVGLMAINRV